MKKILISLVVFVLVVGCGSKNVSDKNVSSKKKDSETDISIPSEYNDSGIFKDYYESAYKKLMSMNIDEKIGQMLLVRMDDTRVDSIINDYHVSGFVMFSRDFKDKSKEDIKAEIDKYQSESKIPLLFIVDEEGGTVVRISSNPKLRDSVFKSPQDIYNETGMDGIISDTKEKSELLSSLGINVNLAPVADVSTNNSDYIYDRSFGKSASETSKYIETVVSTYNKSGLGSCLKHFPGYGNNVDTHTGVAIDNRDYSVFEESDFLPFKAGIEAGVPSILVSHNIVKSMDSVPSSLSVRVHKILRDDLGFTGVIITDDLEMDAISKYVDNANVEAVKAGNDLLITTDYETSFNDIKEAYNNNAIDDITINKAVFRVLAWKYSLGVLHD